ncbi:Homeodomain-like protein [Favolaschia claudopus]|uniref:Homeodomain-like protein n=1 Tax=Favolaschia claudopus TaxID=2862362 RepID=A0AAW0A7F4_9AGAR
MGHCKDIPENTRANVVHLHYFCGRKQADVAHELGVSLSSVEKILRRHRREELEEPATPTYRIRGRPRLLHVTDVDFLVALVERTPDIYLREMQAELRELCNVEASLTSIWTALRRRGYTRKRRAPEELP